MYILNTLTAPKHCFYLVTHSSSAQMYPHCRELAIRGTMTLKAFLHLTLCVHSNSHYVYELLQSESRTSRPKLEVHFTTLLHKCESYCTYFCHYWTAWQTPLLSPLKGDSAHVTQPYTCSPTNMMTVGSLGLCHQPATPVLVSQQGAGGPKGPIQWLPAIPFP